MKKFIIILIVALTSITLTQAIAQKHRHTPRTVQQSQTVQQTQTAVAQPAELVDSVNKGITVYSDTTSADSATSAVVVSQRDTDDFDINIDSPSSFLVNTVSGMMIAMIVALAMLVFAPIIFVALILFYLYKRSKQKDKLMREAIDKGVMPEQFVNTTQQNNAPKVANAPMMQKAIKNISIGLGLVVMFNVIDVELFAAIGWFVAIYGAGQLILAYFSGEKADIKFRNPIYTEEVVKEEESSSYTKNEKGNNASTSNNNNNQTTDSTTDHYDKSE